MRDAIDTPLMRQYLEIKSKHVDALLFFRMGDFYEMFFDDAVVAAEALEIVLTSRDRNKENAVPMCGVPYHSVQGYIHKLLELGYKVAICEQIEDPRQARGLVKRAVTQVITPGVVLDTEHLDAKNNNFLVAITAEGERYGLAALDLSTFELRTTEVNGQAALYDELARLQPKEVIGDGTIEAAFTQAAITCPRSWHLGQPHYFCTLEISRALVEEKGEKTVIELGLSEQPLAIIASAAALRYGAETQPAAGLPPCRIIAYQPHHHLQIDETSIANLELFSSLMTKQRSGSLIEVMDATQTAMGARLLHQMLSMPLVEVTAIRRRQDAVEFLVEQANLRRQIRELLRCVSDLERLTSRTVLQVVTPRELARLGLSLEQLPTIANLLGQAAENSLSRDLPELLHWPDDYLEDVSSLIMTALVDDPPPVTKEGGVIRPGYNAELDEIVQLCEGGKSDILAIEARERERTGISSLKVRFNRVFGYYIEVTRSNLRNVPVDYQRKQTLANAERFTTPELADYEAKVLGAEERRINLEQELFEDLRRKVACQASRLLAVASRVALLDVMASLAEIAQTYDYTRPEIWDNDMLIVEEGRHPVVERFLPAGQFVPNDLSLSPDGGRMLILTGPNMAGKSTIMRQTALITLMAQMGSFVPARRAHIGVVDRIFTRVGASDNLARGESTFMVEMRETASILRHATSRSLVVLDEIGRGTATYDGISIAWAVAEYLHDRVRAKCLFATHYHELCALAETKAMARNFTIAVQEWKNQVVFLRKLIPGGSNRSYGIEVARLAGLERAVVDRARKILNALETGDIVEGVPLRGRMDGANSGQLSLFDQKPSSSTSTSDLNEIEKKVIAELQTINPDQLTPLEALNRLAELKAHFPPN